MLVRSFQQLISILEFIIFFPTQFEIFLVLTMMSGFPIEILPFGVLD
jgi:hypothetical protein